jgi:anti-sigma factor RsiW
MTTPADRPPASGTEDRLLLHAHVDGELDPIDSLGLERRLQSDPALAGEYARLVALKNAIERRATRHTLSAPARHRILRQFGERPSQRYDWRALAASVVVAAFVGSGATYLAIAPYLGTMRQQSDSEIMAIIAGHQRGILAGQPVDIRSSDRHTVKPWLSSKLAASPPVTDFAGQGFALVGGRIDIVDAQPVPTLVYRRNEHLISLTAIPTRPGSAPTNKNLPHRIAGYHVVNWQTGDFSYFAVSDIEPAELAEFVDLYRNQAP